ncbi:MAG: fluoride efflux transporter CrcB [Candidatus Binatus sp.]|uniref:fluoride efflux transporter CrcB n=1 Tax=Candidatus Binatus sp. TaxID=2811406 RepID=UPI003C9EB493
MLAVLLVAIGGGIGSATRYLVGGWFAARFGSAFPYGTFAINVTASFIIGFFLAFAQERVSFNPHLRLFVAVGFIGGYSTFSTFEYESVRLLQDGEMLLGAVYILGSVITGGLAAIGGIALGSWL